MRRVEAIVDIDDVDVHLRILEKRLSFLNGDEQELLSWLMQQAVGLGVLPELLNDIDAHVNQTLQCMDEFVSARYGFMDQKGLEMFLVPLYCEDVIHSIFAVFYVTHIKLRSLAQLNPRLIVQSGELIGHNVLRLDCHDLTGASYSMRPPHACHH